MGDVDRYDSSRKVYFKISLSAAQYMMTPISDISWGLAYIFIYWIGFIDVNAYYMTKKVRMQNVNK